MKSTIAEMEFPSDMEKVTEEVNTLGSFLDEELDGAKTELDEAHLDWAQTIALGAHYRYRMSLQKDPASVQLTLDVIQDILTDWGAGEN